MERLWSYLRRFSRMTKEMRPSHRTDILTSALVYYGIQTKEKLRKSHGCHVMYFACHILINDTTYLSFLTSCPMGPSS